MKNCNTGRLGFTLIELLVVVLIVGILAAVALPQYQKAVLKTKYSRAKALAYAYYNAANTYYLAANAWPTEFAALDVDLPTGSTLKTPHKSNCGVFGDTWCCLNEYKQNYQAGAITCGTADYAMGVSFHFEDGEKVCFAQATNPVAVKICKTEGASCATTNFATPEGHKTGYTYCQI